MLDQHPDVIWQGEAILHFFKDLLPDYLDLVYEDDVEHDPCVGYRRLCAHLGLEPVEVSERTQRATPYPMSQIVENFEEVRAKLGSTRFEWMLEE